MNELTIPDHCANLDCANRPGQGKFVLVESRSKIVGGHRFFRIMLCAPCADALLGLLKES